MVNEGKARRALRVACSGKQLDGHERIVEQCATVQLIAKFRTGRMIAGACLVTKQHPAPSKSVPRARNTQNNAR
jgi:hypothetical protein